MFYCLINNNIYLAICCDDSELYLNNIVAYVPTINNIDRCTEIMVTHPSNITLSEQISLLFVFRVYTAVLYTVMLIFILHAHLNNTILS